MILISYNKFIRLNKFLRGNNIFLLIFVINNLFKKIFLKLQQFIFINYKLLINKLYYS